MSNFPFRPVDRRRSQAQERRVAAAMGGRVVAASGALPSLKGDVRTPRWLVECKTTEKPSYTLTLKVLQKIEKEAIIASKAPALQVDIAGRRYVVLDYDTWVSLLQ